MKKLIAKHVVVDFKDGLHNVHIDNWATTCGQFTFKKSENVISYFEKKGRVVEEFYAENYHGDSDITGLIYDFGEKNPNISKALIFLCDYFGEKNVCDGGASFNINTPRPEGITSSAFFWEEWKNCYQEVTESLDSMNVRFTFREKSLTVWKAA